jgi:hypothetical protein
MKRIFPFSSIWIGCINIASAYECYACTSTDKKECGDPFNANAMVNSAIKVLDGGACIVCFITIISFDFMSMSANIFYFAF